ncbi:MAG: hypothetical protein ABSA49_02890 [Rhizomicrobium sp.]|jgi:hypothetical protein
MSENRKQILDMLAAGKITADEAERLIAALERAPGGDSAGAPTARKPLPKYLRVVVEAEDDHGADTLTKVNIRVPFQLLRAGVKIANFLPPKARTQVNEALREKGVDFDLNQIKPENLDELIEQLQDTVIDIDHDRGRAKVKIFCE